MEVRKSLSVIEENALTLFKFYKISKDIFFYRVNDFRFIIRPFTLLVRINATHGQFPTGVLSIIDDENKQNLIYRKWGEFDVLVRDLIDNRLEYTRKAYCYKIYNIINTFNIIPDFDLSLKKPFFTFYAVKKIYEESYWVGIGKDNRFKTFKETQYFLSSGSSIYKDPYINMLFDSNTEIIDEYESYKSSLSTKQTSYEINIISIEERNKFWNKYSYKAHLKYLSDNLL